MQKVMLSLSAIPLSKARKYAKGWNKGRYADLFVKHSDSPHYRIYFPFEHIHAAHLPVPKIINEKLNSLGYSVEDYRAGIAVDANGRRRVRIGKLLGKFPEVQKLFNEDKLRAAKDRYYICISRHPYDIAGMSTGRGWRSCMNLEDGENLHRVIDEVVTGSLIAYLVNEKDLNIKNPTARILIKPFYKKGETATVASVGNNPLFICDKVYGHAPAGFVTITQKWLDENFNRGKQKGIYFINAHSYDDGLVEVAHFSEDDADAHFSIPKDSAGTLLHEYECEQKGIVTGAARSSYFERYPKALAKLTGPFLKSDVTAAAKSDAKFALDFYVKNKTRCYGYMGASHFFPSSEAVIQTIIMRDPELLMYAVDNNLIDELGVCAVMEVMDNWNRIPLSVFTPDVINHFALERPEFLVNRLRGTELMPDDEAVFKIAPAGITALPDFGADMLRGVLDSWEKELDGKREEYEDSAEATRQRLYFKRIVNKIENGKMTKDLFTVLLQSRVLNPLAYMNIVIGKFNNLMREKRKIITTLGGEQAVADRIVSEFIYSNRPDTTIAATNPEIQFLLYTCSPDIAAELLTAKIKNDRFLITGAITFIIDNFEHEIIDGDDFINPDKPMAKALITRLKANPADGLHYFDNDVVKYTMLSQEIMADAIPAAIKGQLRFQDCLLAAAHFWMDLYNMSAPMAVHFAKIALAVSDDVAETWKQWPDLAKSKMPKIVELLEPVTI